MPTWMLPFLLEVLPKIPELVQDGENIFAGIEHRQIGDVIAGLGTLLHHASGALGSNAPPPTAPAA